MIRVIPTEQYFSIIREQLAENGKAYIRVTGTSMQPLLRHMRDGVIIVPPDRIRKGDIILFDRMNGRYALHRVIRKGKTGFSMAGDNQGHMETGLSFRQIVGVVSRIDRDGKDIPCTHAGLLFYGRVMAWLARPRIYTWQAVSYVRRLFRRTCGNAGR